jgi:NADPH2:quinone reductase
MSAAHTQAVRVHEFGGPDAMRLEEIELPAPGPGEAQVRHEAIGLNYIDVYHRSGLYPQERPFVLGQEAAGVVAAVGPGVRDVKPGDRVVARAAGAYAGARNLPAAELVRLPDDVSTREAAAVFLKGLTVEMLLFRIARVERGWPVLVHAAAGGVGLILTRWAAALGCEVIGTVGSEAKAALAREAGCAHVILYRDEDVADRVRELTGGAGVRAAFDAVGKATQAASLDSLARRGWYVSFGNASGPPEPIAPLELLRRGSLLMTRPSVMHYIADKAEREAAAARLFEAMRAGHVRAEVRQTFSLADVAAAHRALEARETTGATLLLP